MRKDHYKDLKLLVEGMRDEEIEVAKRFIVSFDSNVTLNNNKSLSLFKLIAERPRTPREMARDIVSEGITEASFDRLIKRLRDKLLESLLLNINTRKKELHPPLDQVQFRLRKQLMQVQIMVGRGLRKQGQSLLRKTLVEAQRVELYEVMQEALRIKRNMLALEADHAGFEVTSQELKYAMHAAAKLALSEEMYLRQFLPEATETLNLEQTIAELEEAWQETASHRIGHYMLGLKIRYFLGVGDPSNALSASLQRLELVRNHIELFPNHSVGTAVHDLAFCMLHDFDFSNAVDYARLAKQYFVLGEWEYDRAVELEAKALLLQNHLQDSMLALNEALHQAGVKEVRYSPSLQLLKAAVLFQLQDYAGCVELLDGLRKEVNWDFDMQLLEILAGIERVRLSRSKDGLATLTQGVERLVLMHSAASKRQHAIASLLSALVEAGLTFNAVPVNVQQENLAILHNAEATWRIDGGENIVFEQWWRCATYAKPYQFDPEFQPATTA